MSFKSITMLAMVIIFFFSCAKKTLEVKSTQIYLDSGNITRRLRELSSVNIDKIFINIIGDGMSVMTKVLSSSEVDSTINFTVPVGTNRQVKALAFSGFEGSDFLSVSSVDMLSGQSNLFPSQ